MSHASEPDLFNPYPPTLSAVKTTGSLRFRHPCHICGGFAPFGVNVNLRAYLKNPEIKAHLGIWTCGLEGCKHAA